MNEFEKELKKSLSQEKGLDEDKKAQLKKRAIAYFDRSLHKSERVMLVCVFFCLLMILASWLRFSDSTYTKQQIFYGITTVIGFVVLVFIGLLSFILNNRIGMLKELRLMRLGVRDDTGGALKNPLLGNYIKAEIIFWIIGFAAAAIIIVLLFSPSRECDRIGLLINKQIHISASGNVKTEEHVSYPVKGRKPLCGFSLGINENVNTADWELTDKFGRALFKSYIKNENEELIKVDVYEPSMPGSWNYYELKTNISSTIKNENKLLVYQHVNNYKYPDHHSNWGKRHKYTVYLPKGAVLVSAEPSATEQYSEDGMQIVRYILKSNKTDFGFTIKYKL